MLVIWLAIAAASAALGELVYWVLRWTGL